MRGFADGNSATIAEAAQKRRFRGELYDKGCSTASGLLHLGSCIWAEVPRGRGSERGSPMLTAGDFVDVGVVGLGMSK